MDQGAVFVANLPCRCLGSALMGFIANYPIALAPGMGLNAIFTYSVVLGAHHSWQVAIGRRYLFLGVIFFKVLAFCPYVNILVNSILNR